MPESGITKHNYLFCQFVNPARGHEGDRCDCFDTPSQRRTTLAKQRLARLRANREVNRASTSNDPESAVASDPAVTIKLGPMLGRGVVASALQPFHPKWYCPWSILLVVRDQYPLNFGSSSHSSQYQESLMNSTGL